MSLFYKTLLCLFKSVIRFILIWQADNNKFDSQMTWWWKHKPQNCLSHVRWTLAFLALTTPVKSAVQFYFSHSWLTCKKYDNVIHALKTFPRKIGKVSYWMPFDSQTTARRFADACCICILIRGRNGENNGLAAGATPPPPLLVLHARF